MDKPHGIIVFGANGSGKTTLGRAVAKNLGFIHIDHEAYAFKESILPYAEERPYEECLKFMLKDIKKHGAFVLSAVTGDFGDEIPKFYQLAVYLSVPLDLRIKRMEQREYERHGERIREGGDMYESHRRFINFATFRSLSKIDQWANTLSCPTMYIDGTEDWRVNARKISERYHSLMG